MRGRFKSVQLAALGALVLGGGLAITAQVATRQPQKPYTTWSAANGTVDSANYSALTQINRSNVNQLKIAWQYNSGDTQTYNFQPLVAGRKIFVAAQGGSLVAVDAATGKELWVHKFTGAGIGGYRGLNYWRSADGSDERVFVRADNAIQAINANTGELVAKFGIGGKIPTEIGMTAGTPAAGRSPGQVFENLLILGSATGEAYGSAPADIRAFDTVTGRLAWTFHTIPHPGEPGYETWPKDAWIYTGGAANWGEMSVDEARGIVYIPTGSPKNEFWGGDRHGDALYGTCILALDARTGKKLWHYQAIHHDVWEYELVAAPQLLTVRVNGQQRDIVAQASKNGFLYVLDRVTGQPIWPIPEKPVPPSDMPGEMLSKTQPFPSKPPAFARQKYTLDDVDQLIMTPEERAHWIEVVKAARNDGLYTPISDKYYTLMMPGHSGGAALFSTSADVATGTAYVISFDQPAIMRYTVLGQPIAPKVVPRMEPEHAPFQNIPEKMGAAAVPGRGRGAGEGDDDEAPARGGGAGGRAGGARGAGAAAPAAVPARGGGAGGRGVFTYPPGITAPTPQYAAYTSNRTTVKPPYSTITAYDLNAGTIKWQVPFGEAIGIGEPGNNYGIDLYHGPKARLAITAGGIAITATPEAKARAYDKDTGKVLWEMKLPARAQGAPAVYEVDGKQYVAFTLVGSYVAVALP